MPPLHAPPLLVWFRRDLRHCDHAALYHALKAASRHGERRVHCVFVFDTEILDALPRADRRVEFIHASVSELRAALERAGGALHVLHGRAREEVPRLALRLGAAEVHLNRDYEPQALERDAAVREALAASGIALHSHKDQVIFERDEVLTRAGQPYSVFTPYRNAWLDRLTAFHLKAYPVAKYFHLLAAAGGSAAVPTLGALGFTSTNLRALRLGTGMSGARAALEDFRPRLARYRERRDYPALAGPSYLSVHLRFGTLSIRELAALARNARGEGAGTWLSELVWRDFYFMILATRPDVVTHAFKRRYDAIRWEDDAAGFRAWCEARTGYPLVDAAMRQLNSSGYMHNRLRMLTASFLTKDLGIDWRLGERYFAERLNDYDLAANNGGWQWAASTGCDAQPWFRVFNPVTQSEKFDPRGAFIRRYLPELARVPDALLHAPWRMSAAEQREAAVVIGRDYPAPIVDHAAARLRTLARYGAVGKE